MNINNNAVNNDALYSMHGMRDRSGGAYIVLHRSVHCMDL